LLITIGLTAFMSMWLSNIAAAALMFACLRPILSNWKTDDMGRRTLLVGVALGANLGGIATPIGTGRTRSRSRAYQTFVMSVLSTG
jgi:sodium-dependent dicarboxylate transporter 2/3/5